MTPVINPYNDEIIGEVELAGPADVERALQRADAKTIAFAPG